MQLSLVNVINISVSAAPIGAGNYNTSNLALFTRDTPGGGFGSDGFKIYKEPTEVGTDFGTGSTTFKMANAVFSQSPNILAADGYLVVIPFLSMETLDAAIVRTKDLVQYFGLIAAELVTSVPGLASAAVVQPLNKILGIVSQTPGDIDPGGYLDLVRSGSFSKTRELFYGAGAALDALVYLASYMSRGLSTNFAGSKTTQNMHLKDMIGVQPDSTMTQTLLNKAQIAGADVYISLQGVPKTFCSGKNRFFDQVYNQEWFTGALQIAGFNALATTSTKLPQTEEGIDVLKGAWRQVCQQAVTNGYFAPGKWNSGSTFGKLEDFLRNILEIGYYIFTQPIGSQSQADRVARKAPLGQIAGKEAGAIDSSSILVFINA